MMSGVSPIPTKGIMGPDSANFSGNRSQVGLLAGEGKQEPVAQSMDLKAVTDELNHKINRIHNVDLQFSVHEGSGQLLVKVMDAATGELIREIPPSELLDLAAKLDEMIGLILDQLG